MVDSAKVITDGGELPHSLRSDRNLGGLARLDIGIDLQRLEIKSVRHVFADDPQLHRLTFFQGDLIRGECEALCRNLDHLRLLRTQMHWGLNGNSTEKKHQHNQKILSVHSITTAVRIC